MFCYAPIFCDSFQRYDMTEIFGKTLLRAVFKYHRKQILDQFHRDRESIPVERRKLLLTNFPPFLNQLDGEISFTKSPIWDVHFKMNSIPFTTLDSKFKGKFWPVRFRKKICHLDC